MRKMKWCFCTVLMIGLLTVVVSAEMVTGTCGISGKNLKWEYDSNTYTLIY